MGLLVARAAHGLVVGIPQYAGGLPPGRLFASETGEWENPEFLEVVF